jgi:hypothetical protein
MVRNFFQGIREDIKESIEPPRKALVVVEESEETVVAAPAATEDEEALSNVPRAIPAELPIGDEVIAPDDEEVMDENIEEP